MKFITAALALAVLSAGCSGSANNAPQNGASASGANAPASVADSSSTATTSRSSAGSLPIYPGAKPLGLPSGKNTISTTTCGMTLQVTDYKVPGASLATVTSWYAERIPGGIRISQHEDSGMQANSIFAPDGSAAAVAFVNHINLSPELAQAAKRFGMHMNDDGTVIGIETFSPSLSPDLLQLITSASNGDAATKSRIREQLKSRCPDLAKMSE